MEEPIGAVRHPPMARLQTSPRSGCVVKSFLWIPAKGAAMMLILAVCVFIAAVVMAVIGTRLPPLPW